MLSRRQQRHLGNFGQTYPPGVIPHGGWGRGAACFKSSTPGTGGAQVNFPGSAPALVGTCRVSGDSVSCDDSKIISLSDQVYSSFSNEDYMLLPQSTKEALKAKANDVRRRLGNLKDKGNQTLSEWKDLESEVKASKGKMNQKVTDSWSNASSSMTEVSNLKYGTFVEIDMLMVYAPKAEAAKELCAAKLDAERSFQLSLDKIGAISRNVSNKIAEFYQKRDDWLALIQNLFQAFLNAITMLMNIILDAFSALPAVANWFLKHPKVSMSIGIFIALGLIGIFLRPYLTLAGAVLGG